MYHIKNVYILYFRDFQEKNKTKHAILDYSIIFSEIYLDTKVSVILCPILSQRLIQ